MTAITEAERLRSLLREKKAEKAEKALLRFEIIIDGELASRVQLLKEAFNRLDQLVETRREQLAQAEDAGGRDLRASGDDTAPEAAKLARAEAELARVRAEMDEAIEQSSVGRFFAEFRPCSDQRYVQVLAAHPGANEDIEANAEFQNALVEECFWRFTDSDGNELPLYDSWAEFVADAEWAFGVMDDLRTAVMVACRRNPHLILSR